ncbi:uncharacterized protein BO97DRAFT_409625 [Aspergillus homomorphus CBS 101889]|uniref:Uncharacterized protein n=1 Tax=Aspergillus homomorphus (strain CBS 101889) TaxID=1450537 RepID=A0A395IB00_ASPHC|nr:hypothetical protein BO97DRAFT_409625 [Aspergillus homomorphus CBS 101889]RAL17145.1 hypothetical protein BO97DRAFT_409625 [Aspergillus homomorphus CBS 101889]
MAPSKGSKRPPTKSYSPEIQIETKKQRTVCGFEYESLSKAGSDHHSDEDNSDSSDDETSNQLFVEENSYMKTQAAEKNVTKAIKDSTPAAVEALTLPKLPEGMQSLQTIINEYMELQQKLVEQKSKLDEVEKELRGLTMENLTKECQYKVDMDGLREQVDDLKAELLQVKTERAGAKETTPGDCENCAKLRSQVEQIFDNFRPSK